MVISLQCSSFIKEFIFKKNKEGKVHVAGKKSGNSAGGRAPAQKAMYSPELLVTVSRADRRCHRNFLFPGNFSCPSKKHPQLLQISPLSSSFVFKREWVIDYLCFLTTSKNHFKWRICWTQRNKLSICYNTRNAKINEMCLTWCADGAEDGWGTGLVLMLSACSL